MKRVQLAQAILVALTVSSLAPQVSVVQAAIPLNTAANTVALGNKQQTLTDTQIRQMFNETQAAANRKNVDGLVKFLAPTVSVELIVHSAAGSQLISLNHDQYLSYLYRGFSLVQNYQYSAKTVSIEIDPSGKSAIATSTVTEQGTVNGQSFKATSTETTQIELIEGRALVTSIRSTSTFE